MLKQFYQLMISARFDYLTFSKIVAVYVVNYDVLLLFMLLITMCCCCLIVIITSKEQEHILYLNMCCRIRVFLA